MKEISLTRRWKKLGTLCPRDSKRKWMAFTIPGTPGSAVYKFKGDEIWMRWEPAVPQPRST